MNIKKVFGEKLKKYSKSKIFTVPETRHAYVLHLVEILDFTREIAEQT